MINMMRTMKMKSIAVSLAATLAITISCEEDFLDVAATGSLGEAQLTTSSGIDGTLIGAYSALNGVFGNRFEGPNHWVTGSVTGGEANKGTDILSDFSFACLAFFFKLLQFWRDRTHQLDNN